jgi:hypothetical protein
VADLVAVQFDGSHKTSLHRQVPICIYSLTVLIRPHCTVLYTWVYFLIVQILCSELLNTLSTDRKLQPKWLPPHRIAEVLRNSYKIETMDGNLLEGYFHAC